MIVRIAKFVGTLALASIAFSVMLSVSGALLPALGLPAPSLPEGADAQTLGLVFMAGSLLLALALALVAQGTASPLWARWLILALLMWVTYAVNNVIEGAIYSTFSAVSSPQAMLFTGLSLVLPSLAMAAVIAATIRPPSPVMRVGERLRGFVAQHGLPAWSWRIAVAILAFPAIYLAFGRLVEPLIRGYYERGAFELALPGWQQIITTQLLRSVLFLAACIPVLITWDGSRLQLFLALGFALFVYVGGFSMLTTYWFSWPLRVFHGIEILVDEFAYAAVLVLLFRLH